MIIAPLLLLAHNVCAPYNCDAYAICKFGDKPPLEICLKTVDKCLRRELRKGTENDIAFEWCAETVPPWMVGIVQ